ncbi:hypothetical protein [Labedaea rhizosphaerae]|uniref:Uncharacterized protein n=1 Tax=Labedaea rhizosphaerae TaxID=598644 RepID=A0A4V3CZW2_LABRH|nr:hypothetical protein [Labedaea rhizosphaerae]TDQ01281.1 hypothetical protein EV186_1021149 [Labedaea rhizosphaerae]
MILFSELREYLPERIRVELAAGMMLAAEVMWASKSHDAHTLTAAIYEAAATLSPEPGARLHELLADLMANPDGEYVDEDHLACDRCERQAVTPS